MSCLKSYSSKAPEAGLPEENCNLNAVCYPWDAQSFLKNKLWILFGKECITSATITSLFKTIYDFIQRGSFWKAWIGNIPSPYGQTSLKRFYLSPFIWLRLTGFLWAFLHRFFPSWNTLGTTSQETSYTHLYPRPFTEQHMQRFGTENPHYIICMFFLLPQEASDCVISSLPCFSPNVLTWPHKHICQTPSGG